MKFKAIEELPRAKKHLQKFLEDFMNSGEAFVEVIFRITNTRIRNPATHVCT